jgi:hypothetical protein
MTRKGFLSLAVLPFLGKKKSTPPPVAIALAEAGIAAIQAMHQTIIFKGNLSLKGSDLMATLERIKGNDHR